MKAVALMLVTWHCTTWHSKTWHHTENTPASGEGGSKRHQGYRVIEEREFLAMVLCETVRQLGQEYWLENTLYKNANSM